MTDRAPNKKRIIIAKFVNFYDKQEVLSEYKARKLWTEGIFINKDFSKDTMDKRKSYGAPGRREACPGRL